MRATVIFVSIFTLISLFLFFFQPTLSFLNNLSSYTSPLRSFIYEKTYAVSKPTANPLELENKKLREKLVDYSSLKKDNDALRSQFQESFIAPASLLPAKVVGFKGNLSNPDILILDQGEKAGVKKGMAVILKKDLVGIIGKVSLYNSDVILPISKSFSTLAATAEGNGTGIINGENDFMILDHVVITDNITRNDTVVTKDNPAGLIIGKIISVNKTESKPFQEAIVKSFLSFRNLTTVFVVK